MFHDLVTSASCVGDLSEAVKQLDGHDQHVLEDGGREIIDTLRRSMKPLEFGLDDVEASIASLTCERFRLHLAFTSSVVGAALTASLHSGRVTLIRDARSSLQMQALTVPPSFDIGPSCALRIPDSMVSFMILNR